MSQNDIITTARTYRELQAEIKTLQEQADALKAAMVAELDARQADTLTAGEHVIRHSLYQSSRVDTARLKQDGLYEQYSTSTTALRFSVA